MNDTYNPRISLEMLFTVWCIISTLISLTQVYEVFRPATTLNWIATAVGILFIGILLALVGHFERMIGEAEFL